MVAKHWTLDRRVPVAVILAIVLQTAGAIWWAASVSSRIDALEKARLIQEGASGDRERRLQAIERDVPVIREKIENIRGATDRIEKKLDKLSRNFGISERSGIDELMMLSLAELSEVQTS